MMNYIKSDLYRNLNRLFFWILTSSISAIVVLFTILIYKISLRAPSLDFNLLGRVLSPIIIIPIFVNLFFIELVTGDEIRNGTLKNSLSFGVNRNIIVISKVITTAILYIISASVTIIVFTFTILIMVEVDKNIVIEFFSRISLSSVLWLGSISLGTFIFIIFDNSKKAILTYIIMFLMSKPIINIVASLISSDIKYINKILITTNLKVLYSEPLVLSNIVTTLIIGIAYIIIFVGLSMLYIRNKEIK